MTLHLPSRSAPDRRKLLENLASLTFWASIGRPEKPLWQPNGGSPECCGVR